MEIRSKKWRRKMRVWRSEKEVREEGGGERRKVWEKRNLRKCEVPEERKGR